MDIEKYDIPEENSQDLTKGLERAENIDARVFDYFQSLDKEGFELTSKD